MFHLLTLIPSIDDGVKSDEEDDEGCVFGRDGDGDGDGGVVVVVGGDGAVASAMVICCRADDFVSVHARVVTGPVLGLGQYFAGRLAPRGASRAPSCARRVPS